jgi:DNA invertase Pin-like site-specific DNA recombinase
VVDLGDIAASADGVAKIVLESIQEMLLKLALQMARDDFEDRRERQRQGIELAKAGGKYAVQDVNTARTRVSGRSNRSRQCVVPWHG